MYDLRNHGKSEDGACEWITGGVEEYKDVIAAVDFITKHPDYQDARIGLVSICTGANSTTYGYGIEGGLQEFGNIKALMAIQPLGYVEFLVARGIPGFIVNRANKLNMDRGGEDFYTSCLPQVKEITVPAMVVQNKNDPWTKIAWVEQYYDELTVEKEMLWLDGSRKRFYAYDYFAHSPQAMLEFFGKHV
jgi:hypothetical protein